MNVLDLFSGIGGFSLGLERAGMRTVAFCEIEPFCRRVLAKHWPGVPIYDDVRSLTVDRLRADGIAPDVICGGFPCQDISIAGKAAGIDGSRSGLWSEYARIVGELRPRYVIVENVAALLGRGLDRVLRDLAALGYDAEWHCIPACAVGAPHIRDRIWIVAYPRCSERGKVCSARQRLAWAECLSQWKEGPGGPEPGGKDVAYTYAGLHAGELVRAADPSEARGSKGRHQGQGEAPHRQRVRVEPSAGREDGADADCSRLPASGPESFGAHWRDTRRMPSSIHWWSSEPDVGRVANGVPSRVDRIGSLGNAVVPQIPEIIGRAILEHERVSSPKSTLDTKGN